MALPTSQNVPNEFFDDPFGQNDVFLNMLFVGNGGFFEVGTSTNTATARTNYLDFIDMIGLFTGPSGMSQGGAFFPWRRFGLHRFLFAFVLSAVILLVQLLEL
jgi:hypothetical protein